MFDVLIVRQLVLIKIFPASIHLLLLASIAIASMMSAAFARIWFLRFLYEVMY